MHWFVVVKRRQKLFDSSIAEELNRHLQEKATSRNNEIGAVAVDSNHFHFLLKSDKSPSEIAQTLGELSHHLRVTFEKLKKLPVPLWGGKACIFVQDAQHLYEVRDYIKRHNNLIV